MAATILIADSGATKTEWCLRRNGKKKTFFTQGISPYFLNKDQVTELLKNEVIPLIPGKIRVEKIFYYGTGMRNPDNVKMLKLALRKVFIDTKVEVKDDMMAAARSLNGARKGFACNLGTGSFCCFYNGKNIVKQTPGIGYVLGDEGSGAYLGKKVLQYYLYKTFDEDLRYKFDYKYKTTAVAVLENVYRKPLPNRYMAGFTSFLVENRGHFMIENIIEDGLNDFFFTHLCKYNEIWKMPVNFVGGVAFGFKDVLQQLCNSYEFELGKVSRNTMEGLVAYHS